jgi:adenine specific DNA methylase Mod
MKLSDNDISDIVKHLEAGEPLPEKWRGRLFPDSGRAAEIGKEYRLVYEGKARREEVLANTPAAPWQLVRRFCTDWPHADGWRNLLVWGDNLLALRELLADQQGPNLFGTRDKIKLIYIDPPFATRQDFMKDKEKAYRDKVLGSHFIEFLRRRLILLSEILADDGSVYVHLDWKKGHYIKAILDEVFGEQNFLNDIIWQSTTAAKFQTEGFPRTFSNIYAYRKSDNYVFHKQYADFDESYIRAFYKYVEDNTGRRYRISDFTQSGSGPARIFGNKGLIKPPAGKHWIWSQNRIDEGMKKGLIIFSSKGWPGLKRYLDERAGNPIRDIWTDIKDIGPQSFERFDYPTQKPEQLLERIISASSNEGDVVLDALLVVAHWLRLPKK